MSEPACTGTRRCTRCHETKHALAFSTAHNRRDGVEYWCRDCHREYHRRYRMDSKTENARKGAEFSHPTGGR